MSKPLMRKILSRNIDTLVLFCCQEPITGYGLMAQIEQVFGIRLGSGLVYSSLMRLDRDALLFHQFVEGKRGTRKACSYALTAKGMAGFLESIHGLRLLCQASKKKGESGHDTR